jgi:rfaE bifunctional protein kinase chain/domain
MGDTNRILELIGSFSDTRVVLYGDLVLDRFILGTPKRISREAPVIILRHEEQRDIPGGGANALANLASLGVQVRAVAAVGDDEPGGALRNELEARGIESSYIVTVPGYRTPTKVRLLGGGTSSLKHQVARYDIEDNLPDDGSWSSQMVEHLTDAIADAGAVAISDYGYGSVRPELLHTLRDRHSTGPWVCLDSRYRVGAFAGVDGATPNLEELESYSGHRLPSDDAVADAADRLRHDLGARFVLATRGNRGMTLVEADCEPRHIPVHGTDEVADVTGAGDTVLAVLTASLAAGATPSEAAWVANIAAGLVVMKLGTAVVTGDELRTAAAAAGGSDDPL